MRYYKILLLVAFSFLLMTCSDSSNNSTPEPEGPVIPSDAEIIATKARVLNYLTSLSTDNFNGVLSGQNCYHGDEITNENYLAGYNNLVSTLHQRTNKWVGIIGLDYEFSKCFTLDELKSANNVLKDYWDAGGLIALTFTPQNPWTNDESDIINNPGTWSGSGSTTDLTVTTLNDLIDPSKAVYTAWMRKLDRIADALLDLKEAGVIVMFRPMQEMTGNWFWWGNQSHPSDPAPYINVYRHMRDYFTNTKGLVNVIWVYSPCDTDITDPNNDNMKPISWAYPGDSYVDIVAGTAYDDELDIIGYDEFIALGKPFGMGEYSPGIGGLDQTGGLDTRLYATRIKNDYPRVGFWISWHSYDGGPYWSIITNQNYNELMNNPDILTREDISY